MMDTKGSNGSEGKHVCGGGGWCGTCGVFGGGRFRGLASTLLVMLIIFVAAEAISVIKGIHFVGSGVTPSATIQVAGEGKRVTKPDIAEFSFTVSSEASTVQKAQDTVSQTTDKALAYLKAQGVEDKDIQTTGYSIYPRYEYHQTNQAICIGCSPTGTQVLAGYDVSQTIDVKVRDISATGTLIGGLGDLGVTDLGGVSFSVDEKDTLMAQAREDAIADARAKAEKLAHDLGVNLVRVVSFQENSGGVVVPMYLAADSAGVAGAKSAPSVPTGETTITSDVTVVYEID